MKITWLWFRMSCFEQYMKENVNKQMLMLSVSLVRRNMKNKFNDKSFKRINQVYSRRIFFFKVRCVLAKKQNKMCVFKYYNVFNC